MSKQNNPKKKRPVTAEVIPHPTGETWIVRWQPPHSTIVMTKGFDLLEDAQKYRDELMGIK